MPDRQKQAILAETFLRGMQTRQPATGERMAGTVLSAAMQQARAAAAERQLISRMQIQQQFQMGMKGAQWQWDKVKMREQEGMRRERDRINQLQKIMKDTSPEVQDLFYNTYIPFTQQFGTQHGYASIDTEVESGKMPVSTGGLLTNFLYLQTGEMPSPEYMQIKQQMRPGVPAQPGVIGQYIRAVIKEGFKIPAKKLADIFIETPEEKARRKGR